MNADVDMEGKPIDRAMELARHVVHERMSTEPTSAGMWLDTEAREIHVAITGSDMSDVVARLLTQVPPEIQLSIHRFEHPMTDLEALMTAISEYLGREGYWALYGVDLGIRVETNRARVNLKHTTPPEVEAAIRARFSGAPLDVELTTARWVAQ